MDEIECPYCEYSYDLCHDDGAFYNTEEKAEEEQCPECEKFFMVTPSISWNFSADKADCLNGEPCDMRKRSTTLHHRLPKDTKAGNFYCTSCDREEYRNEMGEVVTWKVFVTETYNKYEK